MTVADKTLSKDRLFIWVMLGFWVLLGLVELLRGSVMALSGQQTFNPYRAFSFVTSFTLAWVILSYPILIFFNKTSDFGWVRKISLHILSSVIFGFLQYVINSLIYALLMSNVTLFLDFVINKPIQIIPSALNAALIYWVVIFLLLVLDYYHKFKEASMHSSKLETQLAQAKLQALRMQLHPHFLFNAMNTISMSIRNNQGKEATRMISGLSDMLRMALTGTESSMITVEEELSLLKKYLEIEQLRFEDSLDIRFNIDEKAMNRKVPALILQPLVENAFKHGISKHIDRSQLVITITCTDDGLEISIFNTGPALPPDFELSKYQGIGLKNVTDRLKTIYGSNFYFKLTDEENNGVSAMLKIPASQV